MHPQVLLTKRQKITLFCEARLTKNFRSTRILPAQRFYVLSSDYEYRTDTCQTFFGQTNIAQTCVAHSAIFHMHHDMSHVSTDVIRKERLFSNFADKLAGAINRPCSIDVLERTGLNNHEPKSGNSVEFRCEREHSLRAHDT